MLAGAFSSAVATLLGAFFVFAGILVYATLIRQVSIRRPPLPPEPGAVQPKTFGLPEALLATVLILFLLVNVTASFDRPVPIQLTSRDLIANFLLTSFIVCFVAGFLKLRGLDLDALAGLSKCSLTRALSTPAV